ncbi:MAG TPA: hypothetical protein VM681_07040 [Candidatus Thermoplasmatota archaeon]|nr:hypothetical protein [Candidatus Thermoplasmatota archaeon]
MEQTITSTAGRVVIDWNNFQVGTVKEDARDPKTRELRGLVVALTEDARSRTGTSEQTLIIPASYIYGVRRDQVTLDRSFDEIRKK